MLRGSGWSIRAARAPPLICPGWPERLGIQAPSPGMLQSAACRSMVSARPWPRSRHFAPPPWLQATWGADAHANDRHTDGRSQPGGTEVATPSRAARTDPAPARIRGVSPAVQRPRIRGPATRHGRGRCLTGSTSRSRWKRDHEFVIDEVARGALWFFTKTDDTHLIGRRRPAWNGSGFGS